MISKQGGRPAIPLYGVDTMLFVYHFEGNERLGVHAGRILAAAEAGRCRLVTSVLTLLEILVVPRRQGREDLCQGYREFFAGFPNLSMVPVGEEIAEVAAGLRASLPIRTPDAIHVATAMVAGATAFISADLRIKGPRGLRIIRPEQFRV